MSGPSNMISSMWAQLQKENKLPSGHLFTACEGELTELMKQIDVMVHGAYVEWEGERQRLQAKLDVREQEMLIHKSTLDANHKEVGELRSQIDTMEQSRRDMATEYERQLNVLRDEVSSMKRDYERLQKKYNKHARQMAQDKNNGTENTDINRLTTKIEEYKRSHKEWEEDRSALNRRVDALVTENKTLNEKCLLLQQSASHQENRLAAHRDQHGSVEQGLRTQLSHLETQLQLSRDTVNSQDSQLSRLQAALDDAVKAQKTATVETGQVKDELRRVQAEIRKVESENTSLRRDLESKVEQLEQTSSQAGKMSGQMSHVSTELQQRTLALASLSEKAAEVEHRLRAADESVERTGAELQVALAQRDALRLENRHLRRSVATAGVERGTGDGGQLAETQKHLNEVQGAYNQSLALLEAENTRLKEEVCMVKDQLTSLETGTGQRVEAALRESEKSLYQAKQDQERLLRDAKYSQERQRKEMSEKLAHTVDEYEQKLQDLRNEMILLEEELDTQNRSMRRLGLENEAMSRFVDCIDSEPQLGPVPPLAGVGGYREARTSSARSTPNSYIESEIDSADLAAERFMLIQEERTKELEKKLDLHIEEMERSIDATVQKYLSPR